MTICGWIDDARPRGMTRLKNLPVLLRQDIMLEVVQINKVGDIVKFIWIQAHTRMEVTSSHTHIYGQHGIIGKHECGMCEYCSQQG